MQPKVRVWIDARGESYSPGKRKDVIYRIPGIDTRQVMETVYSTLAAFVWEIQLVQGHSDMVNIIYDPERITPTFIDYLLQQRGVDFQRVEQDRKKNILD